MRARPILFSAPMIRALLAGRKTQTRRLVEPQPLAVLAQPGDGKAPSHAIINRAQKTGVIINEYGNEDWLRSPYGYPGDRLWVRETVRAEVVNDLAYVRYIADNSLVLVENSQEAADEWHDMYCYRGKHGATVPSIHMPQWCSRMTLEITGIRIERLQNVTEQDALAEGAIPIECDHIRRSCEEIGCYGDTARAAFRGIWESVDGNWESVDGNWESVDGNWDANPWVWVIEFKVIQTKQSPAI